MEEAPRPEQTGITEEQVIDALRKGDDDLFRLWTAQEGALVNQESEEANVGFLRRQALLLRDAARFSDAIQLLEAERVSAVQRKDFQEAELIKGIITELTA